MNQDKIGNFIKSIRKEHNLTQKDLADKLGVTYQAVSKWENGKNIPDIEIIKKICDDYDLNIDEILNGEKIVKKQRKNILIKIIPILFIVLGIVIVSILGKQDFEFKTLSSKCKDFKITGSAAYNKDKTSIYISNIEFCGEEEKEVYKEINCTLLERNDKEEAIVSKCSPSKNITLEEYLEEINIEVDDYNTICKRITSNTLYLEIQAKTEEKEVKTYKIPLKLNDNCK